MSGTHRAWQRRLLAITFTAIALGARSFAACRLVGQGDRTLDLVG